MADHIPPVRTLHVSDADEDEDDSTSDDEDELDSDSDAAWGSCLEQPSSYSQKSSSSWIDFPSVTDAFPGSSPIPVGGDNEPEEDASTVIASTATGARRRKSPMPGDARAPILVDSGDESPAPARPVRVTKRNMLSLSRTGSSDMINPAGGLERRQALFSPPGHLSSASSSSRSEKIQPAVLSKRKTKKDREAAAVANMPQIGTFFPVASSSTTTLHRAPLHRALRAPVRRTPLGSDATSVATYDPRVHRPPVIALAPSYLLRRPRPSDHRLYTAGDREARDIPLTISDIRTGLSTSPPNAPPLQEHHKCCICWQLKSHPVTYTCGHGFCYTCIRIWLEHKWECPICRTLMTIAPFRVYAEEDAIASTYGDWDATQVDYDWDGLVFPQLK